MRKSTRSPRKKPKKGADAEKEKTPPQLSRDVLKGAPGNGDEMLGALLIHGAVGAIRSMSGAHDAPQNAIVDLAASVFSGIGPRNGLEGLLAGQMASTHAMAIEFGRRTLNAQDRELIALYGNLSDRLFRTFTRQVDTLARLRGLSSKQTVRVEHVHVESGGQAIVGAVEHSGRGRSK